jgi:hypothetical protein
MMEEIIRELIVRMIVRMTVGIIVRMMVKKMCITELSPHNMYACPQLDTCHVGSFFGPLVPNFRT